MDMGVEVTGFKRAKIGARKERRRGGLAWLAALNVSRPLLALFVAGVAITASWQARSMYFAKKAGGRPAAKKLFSPKVSSADAPKTPSAAASGAANEQSSVPNSLGLVSGSIDGMTPDERAKRASADAAASAAADAGENTAARAQPQTTSDDGSSASPRRIPSGGLNGNGFGAISSLSGGSRGVFGGSGLSGGIGGKFGAMGGRMKAPIFGGSAAAGRAKARASTGNSRAMASGPARRGAAQGFGANGASRSAMGELKTANAMSSSAAGAQGPVEGAAAQSQGAFGEASSGGDTAASQSAGAGGGTGTAPSSGGGAPDLTATQDMIPAAPVGQTGSLGPFQGMMDQIAAMADKAAADMKTGKLELIAGLALLACLVGFFNPVMLAAGLALVSLGIMTIQKGKREASMATDMAGQLAMQMDNKQQATAVNDCTGEILRTAGAVNSSTCTDPEAGVVGGSSTGINQNETKDTGQIQRVKDEENAAQ